MLDDIHLYKLTLKKPNGITHAIKGNFSGTANEEIVVCRRKMLELYKLEKSTSVDEARLRSVLAVEVFNIRSLIPIRPPGSMKDYLLMTSDGGKMVISEFNSFRNVFEKLLEWELDMNVISLPIQYSAVDPRGRCFMVGALKQFKLLYVMKENESGHLELSEPAVCHTPNTIVHHIVGVDNGSSGPTFASLEKECLAGECPLPLLAFYELQFDQRIRRTTKRLRRTGNLLVPVPGCYGNPGGVLVCGDNVLMYEAIDNNDVIECPIPRRHNDIRNVNLGVMIVCSSVLKKDSGFHVFLQTEQGDVFRVNVAYSIDESKVTEIKVRYYDTLPVASSICVLKDGFLFAACDFANHYLFKMTQLKDKDDQQEFSSSPLCKNFIFELRETKNLKLLEQFESLSPIMSCTIGDLADKGTPQIYITCGKGPRSSLRVLRRGMQLKVSEMAVSSLPGEPNAVWALKRNMEDPYDSYLILSFSNATLVLSVGMTIKEVSDSGFVGSAPTLTCAQIGKDSIVQVFPVGIRHIRSDKKVINWFTPQEKYITNAIVNKNQVVISLTGGEIVYFEVDKLGQLIESAVSELADEITCMAFIDPSSGENSKYLAIGLESHVVAVLSLESFGDRDILYVMHKRVVDEKPTSMSAIKVCDEGKTEDSIIESIYVYVGFESGWMMRIKLDGGNGMLLCAEKIQVGSKPVKLFKISMQDNNEIVAVSQRSYMDCYFEGNFHLALLSYEPLEYASSFTSEQCPEGIVAISSSVKNEKSSASKSSAGEGQSEEEGGRRQYVFKILGLKKFSGIFQKTVMPLKYTPWNAVVHPNSNYLIVLERDEGAYTEKTKNVMKEQIAKKWMEAARTKEDKAAVAEKTQQCLYTELPESIYGAPRAPNGMWASRITVVDVSMKVSSPGQFRTVFELELEQNESGHSFCLTKFHSQDIDSYFLLVGIAEHIPTQQHNFKSLTYIYAYEVLDEGARLKLVSKTPTYELPLSICSFRGKVLVGAGRDLRIYDMDRTKKLLMTCKEVNKVPNKIIAIEAVKDFIVVTDEQEGFVCAYYNKDKNKFVFYAKLDNPMWVTATCLLDSRTVVAGDIMGNINVISFPETSEIDEYQNPFESLWGKGSCSYLNKSMQKGKIVACFNIGERVTTIQKASFSLKGPESIVYTTISGTLGALVRITSPEYEKILKYLQLLLCCKNPDLFDRERAFSSAVNIIDGDLCELFNSLEMDKRDAIAKELNTSQAEIYGVLEEIRDYYSL